MRYILNYIVTKPYSLYGIGDKSGSTVTAYTPLDHFSLLMDLRVNQIDNKYLATKEVGLYSNYGIIM